MRMAQAERKPEAIVAILHRMRGSLVVVNSEDIARFCGVLEQRIATEGLTPLLDNAIKSTLTQIAERFKEL